MHWIVEKAGNPELLAALRAHGRRVWPVRVVPFSHELVGAENDQPARLPPEGEPSFAYGQVSMRHGLRARGLGQAYHEAPDNAEAWARLGSLMLNQPQVSTLGELRFPDGHERIFIRPVEGDKAFPGQVVERGDFEDWKAAMSGGQGMLDKGLFAVGPDLAVAWSPARQIDAEWRVLMSEGLPVAASTYRVLGRLVTRPESVLRSRAPLFARDMAQRWNPSMLYAIDICLSGGHVKVLEYSAASSIGLYALDLGRFIEGVERGVALSPTVNCS